MLKFGLTMLIPLGVFIYTVQFGRWMQGKRLWLGAFTAYGFGVTALGLSGLILWRVFT